MPISDELQRTVDDLLESFRRSVEEMPVDTPPAIEFRPVVDETAR